MTAELEDGITDLEFDIDYEDSWRNEPNTNSTMDPELQDTINAFQNDTRSDDSKDNTKKNPNHKGLTDDHIAVLRENFGHDSFRPMQWDIIHTALIEKRDQCVVMATGYGKSLCFQYPSVYAGRVSIVISPLISLMEDQVMALEVAGIPACFLGSAQTKKKIITEIFDNEYRLVYMTPEYSTGDYGLDLLKNMNEKLSIVLIAIDEAHCVSQWGHDFRHAYRDLGKIRNIIGNVPILAVTATATEHVLKDICRALSLRNPKKICSGFDRPNLYFEVCPKDNKGVYLNLLPYLEEVPEGSVIIYTLTKKETGNICEILKVQGINCEQYHAGLPLKQRKNIHEKFSNDEIKVIIATIAFGMGIDKPDVRLVIHYGASKDMESYYQEVGRAGRDGLPSKCITFFSSADFVTHDFLRQQSYTSQAFAKRHEEMASYMKKYLYTGGCRREMILSYFENHKLSAPKKIKPENCCDNCKKIKSGKSNDIQYEGVDEYGLYDFTENVKLFLETILAMDGRFGVNLYISFMKGSSIQRIRADLKRHSLFGAGSKFSTEWWKAIARMAEEHGFTQKIKLPNSLLHVITVSPKGRNFLMDLKTSNKTTLKIPPPTDILNHLKKKIVRPRAGNPMKSTDSKLNNKLVNEASSLDKGSVSNPIISLFDENDSEDVKNYNQRLFVQLRGFRNKLAHEIDCSPYMIASDMAIIEMVRALPKTVEEFSACHFSTFNYVKVQKFGQRFVDFIEEFTSKNKPPVSLIKKMPQDITTTVPNPSTANNKLGQFLKKSNTVSKLSLVKKSTIFDVSSDEDDMPPKCADKQPTVQPSKFYQGCSKQASTKNADITLSDDDSEMLAAFNSIEDQRENEKSKEDGKSKEQNFDDEFFDDLFEDPPMMVIKSFKRNPTKDQQDGSSPCKKMCTDLSL